MRACPGVGLWKDDQPRNSGSYTGRPRGNRGVSRNRQGRVILTVEDLSVSYGKIRALRDVNLEVPAGEVVGVVGPNGAGKSTLLLAIAGALPKLSGDIRFEGESIRGLRPERIVRRGIGLVPEGRHIFHRLTVDENLRLGTTVLPRGSHEADRDRIFAMFPVLETYRHARAGKLSGGEQQQLAIARALLGRPRLLMLDEPSLGLAPLLVDRVFDALAELRASGTTVLLVEQLARRTVAFADRTFVLRGGEVVVSGVRTELEAEGAMESAFFGFEAPS